MPVTTIGTTTSGSTQLATGGFSKVSMNNRHESGFTLLELLVTIAIVGILAAIAIPQYNEYRLKAQVVSVAADLRNFRTAFQSFAYIEGEYPSDSHNALPPGGIDQYISPAVFNKDTELGGRYNWEGPDSYPYAGIAIFGGTADVEQFEQLDSTLDDGNLNSGMFRQTPNGRYTYIIEEF